MCCLRSRKLWLLDRWGERTESDDGGEDKEELVHSNFPALRFFDGLSALGSFLSDIDIGIYSLNRKGWIDKSSRENQRSSVANRNIFGSHRQKSITKI
jgi:hypothetical protein